MLIYQPAVHKLIAVKAMADGNLDPAKVTSFDARKFGLRRPNGMTIDPSSGGLFILDSAVPEIIHVTPNADQGFDDASISYVCLEQIGISDIRGIAFNPANGHLYILSFTEKKLYEFTKSGKVVAIRDVSEFNLKNPQGMIFAPSGDLTDDPSQMNLYIADYGPDNKRSQKAHVLKNAQTYDGKEKDGKQMQGKIVELSLTQTPGVASTSSSSLVQTMDLSLLSPPSPDPAGITYLLSSNTLLVSDGEVDEMPIFVGVNLFEMSLTGNLLDTLSTTSFSFEPAGLTINPVNKHLFFTDDNVCKVFELDPGVDGLYDTSDDIVTSFSTSDFSCFDPEGIAYDSTQGALFIADGVSSEIHRVAPGDNGVFNGVPPTGDDRVTHFDTAILGVTDPEGIEFNPDNGHLYLIGKPPNILAEITTSGTLRRVFDISAANARKPAGLGLAPGSLDPNIKNIYIVDRGVDNDQNPNENDGKVYEISLPPISPGNQVPTVDAGSDQTIILPADASLDGSVFDDGLPNPPGAVTVTWSKIRGQGIVTFANANAIDTTASFPEVGTYVLRLTVDDGELINSDDVTIVVLGRGDEEFVDVRVAASTDDAEEKSTGNVALTSADLEMVLDGSDQTVGLRFNGINIPKNAIIINAYIQFKADERNSEATSLSIQGENVDNATTFTSVSRNISSRPRTIAAISWFPAPWTKLGELGLNQRTPDISSIIQEIVNRSGWSSGNSLAVIISGTGKRVADAFNGDTGGAPLLHAVYYLADHQPPIVDAGPDQTIALSGHAILDGTVSDDGLPSPPGSVITTWSQISGTGEVTFGDINAIDTTASFSEAGTYVLRLTADDGELIESDDITVVVNGATMVREIRVSASTDDAEERPSGSMLLSSTDLDLVFDKYNQIIGIRFNGITIPEGATITNAYIQFKADEITSEATSLTIQGEHVDNATAFTSSIGDISSRPRTTAAVSWSPAPWTTVGEVGPNQQTPDISSIIQEIMNRPGWLSGNSVVVIFTGTGKRVAEAYDGNQAEAPLLHIEYSVAQVNQSPTANAGADQSITLPDNAILNGTVTDDGLPNPPGVVTATWGVVSGTGTVSFGDVNAVDTTASFSEAGTYVLSLTADDGELNTSDKVTIEVIQSIVNQPPTVDAGVDQSITLPDSATLDGTVTDDGLPTGTLTATWGVVSGTGTVSFGDVNAVDTTASFSEAGTYVLSLTADDGELSPSDEITIEVSNPPIVNQPPTVDAGVDQSITLPDSATLDGTVTDDGLPTGTLTATWGVVSGTGTVSFGDVNAVDTTASFSEAGTYVLSLTADDGELSPSDEITIEVSNPPIVNQPPTVDAGVDQSITLPDSATLDGTVTDDGLPTGTLTVTWGVVSGTGTVSFGDVNALDTTASFSEAGTYVLSLTADDGELITSDELSIEVSNPPIVNQPPTVDAGVDQSITLPDSATLDGTVTDDGLPTGTLTATWGVVSGTGTVSFGDVNAVDTTASFSEAGTYVLSLTADDGELITSDELSIEVSNPPIVNQPPTVDAGVDQSITLPDSATLDGTVTDDGLPTGTLTATWGVVSGTGTVSFGDVNALDTTASFSEAGTYVLSLTADDGELITSDELSIEVSNPPIVNQPPTVDAGVDQSITLPDSATLDGTVTDDGLPTGTLTATWGVVSGTGTVSFGDVNAVDTTASFSEAGTYVLSLTADDGELSPSDEITIEVSNPPIVNQPPTVDAGVDQSITLPDSATLDGTVTDDGLPTGTLTATWGVVSGTGTVSFGDVNAVDTTASFSEAGTYVLSLTADDGELSPSDEITIEVSNPPIVNQPPTVDAGVDQSITLPDSATLDGTVTDDGLPTGTLTATWGVVSGTGTVSFGDVNAVDTTASFSEAGTYVLSLTADDGELSPSDEITIEVSNPPIVNQPPTVDAGVDQSITLPDSATLDGTVTDDGLPTGTLTVTWGVVSGTGTVSFGDVNAVDTTASFSEAGTYVLSLTADDGELITSDELSIEVSNPPIVNQPPTVDAGVDQSITLPDSATLDGTVTDDGLPTGTLTVTWGVVSGTGTVSFGDVNAVDTTASFSEAGTYVLSLTADDGELITSDELSIEVSNPPIVNQPPTVDAGVDQSITLPDSATLDGTVTDDGLPTGTLTATWGVVSGTGTVSFGDVNAVDTTASFSEAGTYVLSLTADDGELITSDEISIEVSNPPIVNQPPTVDAGVDQSITLPDSATLDGTVTDDGLPTGTLTATWGVVSGTGTVSFGDVNAVDTTASFSEAGTYVLSLTADDGELITSDELSIEVSNPPIVNQPPTVDAGVDQSITLPDSATLDGTVTDDGLPTGTLTATWGVVSGTGTVSFGDVNAVDTTASFSEAGTYVLSLTADDGELSPSDEITIEVSNPPIVNQPPTVDAGVDQSITLPDSATLDGTVTDDGLPTGTLTVTWGVVSGTGTVSFGDVNALDTTASFSEAGTYVLSLTADDGELITSDELSIEVSNPPIVNQPPTVDAGVDQSITLPDSATLDGTVTDDGLPTGTLTATWGVVSGTGTVSFGDVNALDTTASFSEAGTYVLSLTADDGELITSDELSIEVSNPPIVNQPPTVDAGVDQSITLPDSATLDGTVTDDGLPTGTLTATWGVVSGTGTVSFGDVNAVDTTASFSEAGTYVLSLTADDGELSPSDEITIEVSNPPIVNQPPTVDAGVDQSITLPDSATLDGTVTDDGLPTGTLTVTWGVVSGTGTVSFGDVNAVDTTASFSEAGTYVLSLTADDGELSPSDEITIEVSNPPIVNQPPTVDAGVDQSITLPDSATLDGTVTDDGLPTGTLTATWGVVSGTGTVSFGDVNAVDTTASFSEAGTYVLSLTADDGELSPSDEITIEVSNPPIVNQPPTVDAGVDQSITLPDSATLDGTVTDDGLPTGTLTATWGVVSGTGTVSFGDVNAVDTTASFSEAGTYVLSLTADDGELITSDELSIEVSNPPIVNQPPTVDAGVDQSITLPDSATLDGTVTDDGLPTGTLTVTWGVVSGTGTVSFGDVNAVDTTASFSEAGTYVLSLTADDGELSPSDEITIEVSNPPIVNQPPTVDAGVDQSITLPDSATLDGTVTDDGLPTGTLTATWGVVSGTGTVSFGDVNAVDTTASFSEAGTYVLSLTADDGELITSDELSIEVSNPPIVNQPPTVDAGVDQSITLPDSATLDGTVTDDGLPTGTLTATWGVVSGTGTVSFGDVNAVDTTASFSEAGTYVLSLTADDGELITSDELSIEVSNPPIVNQPPTVDAGVDQSITLPDSAILDGTVTDDGLPTGTLTATWGVVSGTGTVSFGDVNAVDTTASFSEAGTYVLSLTADDGELSPSDEITIEVSNPPIVNQPPTVDAGVDQSITLPDSATLDGTVTDDGLPTGTLTATWGVVSGTGTVSFGDVNAVDTTASFSEAGTYVLSLTADDGELITSDELSIEVSNPPIVNQPPTVDAGVDQSITLPDSATLDGTVTDDGLPTGTLTATWGVVSGTGTVSFGDVNAVDTTASFSEAGTYVLQLTADDGDLMTSDAVTVVVNNSATLVREIRVVASTDDAEERPSGSMLLSSTDLDLVFDKYNQVIGIRFNGVDIPKNATITNAYIQFKADEITSEATSLTIQGEDVDNAVAFAAVSRNISLRPRTTAAVSWSPAPWTTVGEVGPNQQTPDISSIIQEIMNRPGWSSGNSVVVIFTGTGKRVAEAYDGNQAEAPLLHIEYSVAQGNQSPTVNAGADQSITLPDNAILNGTVTDDGLPNPPGVVTTTWSVVSGPGTVTFGNANVVDTTASFSETGTYVLSLTADDSALNMSDEITVVVNNDATTVREIRVTAGSDDAEERSSGSVILSSTDLDLVFDKNNQTIGMRFNGVDIPKNATIINAYIQFKVDEITSEATSLTIQGEDVDNAVTFAAVSMNISSRPRTTAAVSWSPVPWTTVGVSGSDQQTSDISSVIQEIVNRSGWSNGNSLVVIITGTGRRTAESYEGSQSGAPLLHVVYH
ncbi:hypothetical protein KSU1_C1324 [Candidatus Jettenia caeni]|uniref:PKD/Chitinase domain-containing protein n=1 Tax=Candidatus Jettenia caeni TaxID=247490 RepID=I3IMH5_9BACT|nr:hypothetical protein KSU1_C1324 [Candidatus Jettenia caeni]